MLAIHIKGRKTNGSSKTDRGYLRPQITDGGGGGGGGGVLSGNYGGVAPNVTPASTSFAIDNSTGFFWAFINGAWVYTGIQFPLS